MEPRRRRQTQPGFTLIELVIAIAIVGILTIIAIPSYQQYILRGNRTAAKSFLSDVAQHEEAWFGDRKIYTSLYNLYSAVGLTPGGTLYIDNDGTTRASVNSPTTVYAITLSNSVSTNTSTCATAAGSAPTAYDYVVIATPVGRQNSDSGCMTLCLSSTNVRGASGPNGSSSCWQR